ncbi:RNA polymerase I enhancer binding protein [Lobosporangium transversale]|nr:RNA polymerase I enhancer binding protein [Lobosporangium transversale]
MENRYTNPKKRKQNRDDQEELNAQVFKKALITPAATNGVSTLGSSLIGGEAAFEALGMLGGKINSDNENSDSSEDENPPRKKPSNVSIGGSKGYLTSTSTSSVPATTSASKAMEDANAAVVATVANILSKASAQPSIDNNQQNSGSSDQQQPIAIQSDAGAPITQDQILATIADLRGMQMLLQNDLMNLNNDPSVLATLNNNVDTPMVMQNDTTVDGKDGNIASNKKGRKEKKKDKKDKGKKKSKDKDKDRESREHRNHKENIDTIAADADADAAVAVATTEVTTGTTAVAPVAASVGEASSSRSVKKKALSLEEQLDADLSPARLETRPLLNVYLHIRRMYHPQNNVGLWTKADDAKLIELYTKHKGQWTKIGSELGRMADSCRDRYRNHLKDQDTMVSGPWAAHEDERLLDIMQDLAEKQGKATVLESSHLWTTIAEKMNGTRTRHQCRHRFSQALLPRLERGEFIRTRAGAALAVATAAKTLKQQKQAGTQLEAQPPSTNQNSITNADEEFKMLAAALQNALPNTTGENLLWSQALPASSNNAASGGEHENNIDHDNLTAAIAAVAGLPVSLGTYHLQGAPVCRRARQQMMLDYLKWIQEQDIRDHLDIKWGDIRKEFKTRWQEDHKVELDKVARAQHDLQLQAQRHLQDGDNISPAATAAAAAMTKAAAEAQTESMKILHVLSTPNQTNRIFMVIRCKIEGYRDLDFKTLVARMIEVLEKKIEDKDRRLIVTTTNSERSGGAADANTTPKKVSPKSLGPVHQQHLQEFIQFAAMEALMTQFPQLQQIRLRRQQQQKPGGDATADEDEAVMTVGAVDKQQLSQQQQTRDLAEKMIKEAMAKQGLPINNNNNNNNRNKKRKAKEYISDSDPSSGSADEDDT